MYLSCDCLNISIISKNPNFSNIDSILTETFTKDVFFKEDLAVISFCSINVQVPSLVKEWETGQWRIRKCLNCDKTCYGVGQILEIGSIIARKDLEMETNKLSSLKESELYSPIFKILIFKGDVASDDETGMYTFTDQKTSLYPAAVSWLNEQTALTEERVKLFSEKQYAALDDLRQRAYKDQNAIIRREKACGKKLKSSCEHSVEELQQFTKPSIVPTKAVTSKKTFDDSSLDTEGVFLLDGFEVESEDQFAHEDTDSDGDASEDSTSYRPRRVGTKQLAQSLPIPVPQFMEDITQKAPVDGSPEVPTDIAASIKALAKSIHGDSIFGELPPPRFSTHL